MVFESKCACSCGDSYTGNNVAALGHNYVQNGETYTCTRCGDSYSGHQHTYTETVTEPTCEQDGYTTYTCSCGYSYTDNIVPALGHDYILAGQDETIWTYACTRCGLSYTVVAPIVPEPPVEYSLRNSNVTVTTEHHEYVYASGTLLRETITTTDEEGNVTTETLDFVYDLNGSPYALNYTNGAAATQTYYYITNVQGDVTHLVAADGEVVAAYGYDAWGQIVESAGTMAEVNPLRYRGYYADAESGFYYLQSRYYDSTIFRFINADVAILSGLDGSALSYHLFTYCFNNPIMASDAFGYAPEWWQWVVSGAAVVAGVALTATGVGGVLGGALICAGANSIIGSYTSEAAGGSSTAGWIGGAITGGLCGVGAGWAAKVLNVATRAVGGVCLGKVATAGAVAFGSGFVGSVAGQLATAIWDRAEVDLGNVMYSATTTGVINCLSGIGSLTGIGITKAPAIGGTLASTLNTACAVVTEVICDTLGFVSTLIS